MSVTEDIVLESTRGVVLISPRCLGVLIDVGQNQIYVCN